MGATVQAQIATGAGPSLANAEGGIVYNRVDTIAGTTPIPIPTATGTHFSYLKWLALVVTGTAATSISNRRIELATAIATGLNHWFQDNATYAQATGVNQPADAGTNGATPAGFTKTTTAYQLWDNTSVSAGSTGRSGDYCETVLGVDFLFVGGAGSATALPTLNLEYDEA